MTSRKRRLNIGSIDTLFEDRPNLNQSNRDIHDFKSKSDGQDDFLISTVEEYNRKQQNEIQQVLDDGCDDILNASYVEAMNADREQQNAAPVPKKMNSKSKIERNRLQAIIRRINRGPSGQRKYDYVSEYFWHVEEWPTYAIKALLSKSFNYTERLQLASFLLGNGLRETEIATQFVKLYNTHWSATSLWQKRLLEFEKLWINPSMIQTAQISAPVISTITCKQRRPCFKMACDEIEMVKLSNSTCKKMFFFRSMKDSFG